MELEKWAMNQIDKLDISKDKKTQYHNVLNAFGEQGHSGFSAGYALNYIGMYIEKGYDETLSSLDKMFGRDDDGSQTMITGDIIEIIDLFKEYNFSKEEANNLKRLMNWKPIVFLTGEEDEWSDLLGWGDKTQQNRVCSAVFRDNCDNSTAKYIEGRVYSDNGGHTWFTGNHHDGIIESSVHVTFPFWVPDKPEYVYLNGEDSTEIITDKARIKELYDEWDKIYKERYGEE